jgi:hypothetical protein
MAALLSPRALRRGLQLFALVSVLGVVALLTYTGAWGPTIGAFTRVRPGWMLLTLALASSDWLGGGFRLWILTRHVHRNTPFWGMVVAGGLTAWAGYLTPSGAGGGPMMIYAMKREGVPVPIAMIAAFISFFTTIVFFAIAGPLAMFAGAGQSLRAHGIPLLDISLYDVFAASATTFGVIGLVLVLAIIFPGSTRRLFLSVIGWLERRGSARVAKRVDVLRGGVDRMHDALVAYFRGRGWLATSFGVITSGLAHANRLLAGYVAMRAIGLHPPFVEVLVLQVTISFLLYFAPTPGGAGAAEALSAALMSVYVPNELLAAYTIIWRFTASYATVAFGSYVFYRMLEGRIDEADAAAAEAGAG